MIIDFHTHTFPDAIAFRAVEGMSIAGNVRHFTSGSADELLASMKQNNVTYSVNLPVATRADQVERINNRIILGKDENFSRGIINFGAMHPHFENCAAELHRLKENGIKGIKMHPAYQETHINDIAYKRVIYSASEEGLITLLHTGNDVGYPEDNYAPADELLELIREVKPERLVLAHMGGWQNWESAKELLAGENVWFDTAYALDRFYPRDEANPHKKFRNNLADEEFVSLVRAYGADRVLFATDSPWTDQGVYINIINNTSLTEEEKEKIFFGNALKLLEI